MPGKRWQDDDVRLAAAGDRDAAERLWLANRRWVAAVLLAHKGRHADLEDLLQAVAVRFLERIDTVREPGAFKGWLRTIAVNEAMADGRKVTRRRGHRERIVAEAARSGDDGAGWAEREALSAEAGRVLELAAGLPEAYREPLILRATKQMSYRQIGKVMGLPETTVETRIARGRRMLRELVQDAERGRARAASEVG